MPESETRSWTPRAYQKLNELLSTKEYGPASDLAFRSAIEASKQYRESHEIEDLCHRAIFYAYSAYASRAEKSMESFIQMFFITRYTMNKIGTLPEGIDKWYAAAWGKLERLVNKLSSSVKDAGIDPELDPVIYFETLAHIKDYDLKL